MGIVSRKFLGNRPATSAVHLVISAVSFVNPTVPLVIPAVPLVISTVSHVIPTVPLVIPAKAGIQVPARTGWIPAYAGMTGGEQE